jgi:hypothetical protein
VPDEARCRKKNGGGVSRRRLSGRARRSGAAMTELTTISVAPVNRENQIDDHARLCMLR